MSLSSFPNEVIRHVTSYLEFADWESYTLTSKKAYYDVSEWPENKIKVFFDILETEKEADESFFTDQALLRQIHAIFEAIFNNQPVFISFDQVYNVDIDKFLYLQSHFSTTPTQKLSSPLSLQLSFYGCDIKKLSQHTSVINNLVKSVKLQNSDLSDIKKLNDIFHYLHTIDIVRGEYDSGNKELDPTEQMPSVKTLTVNDKGITADEFLCSLQRFPNLEKIDFAKCFQVCNLKSDEVPSIPSLKIVKASTSLTTNDFQILLKKFPELEEISISGCENIMELQPSEIDLMNSVKSLTLNYTKLTNDDFLLLLQKFPNLETVFVRSCKPAEKLALAKEVFPQVMIETHLACLRIGRKR